MLLLAPVTTLALGGPDVRDRLGALAIEPLTGTPDELEKFIASGIGKWAGGQGGGNTPE